MSDHITKGADEHWGEPASASAIAGLSSVNDLLERLAGPLRPLDKTAATDIKDKTARGSTLLQPSTTPARRGT